MSGFAVGAVALLLGLLQPAEGATEVESKSQEEQDVVVDDTVILEVVVTGTTGTSVFVDRGRDDGLEPGDRVRFLPAGRPVVIGEVRSVSSSSARVEVGAVGAVDVGDGGEVQVPKARLVALAAEKEQEGGQAAPPHPAWTHPPEEWSTDQPLLAPTTSLTPADREVLRHGRAFLQFDWTRDDEGQSSNTYLGRAGADVAWENLFGNGGTLDVDVEVLSRRFEDAFDSDEDTRLRVQRLSYAWGGTRQEPDRWQVGRFLQKGFVEFGLLDGVEVQRRLGAGKGPWHVGASIGAMPEPTFELSTGRDAQVAIHARRISTTRTGFAYGFGYQKTFHDGDADRDLIVADMDWRPTEHHTVRGSALVDYYTSGERAKDAGFELTELHLYGDWRPDARTGISANVDRTRLPDVDRAGFAEIPADQLREQLFERTGLRVWRRFTDTFRLSVRGDAWRNEDDDGTGGEIRADWNKFPTRNSHVSAAVFANDGTFTSVEGLRLSIDHSSTIGFWQLSWELTRNQDDGATVTDPDRTDQSLRASWDQSFGATSLSLFAEKLFGDSQDATSFGIYLQRRL
ncbi:MAG: hypothetical protein R3F34_10730 [Planctomycetota bacterium]